MFRTLFITLVGLIIISCDKKPEGKGTLTLALASNINTTKPTQENNDSLGRQMCSWLQSNGQIDDNGNVNRSYSRYDAYDKKIDITIKGNCLKNIESVKITFLKDVYVNQGPGCSAYYLMNAEVEVILSSSQLANFKASYRQNQVVGCEIPASPISEADVLTSFQTPVSNFIANGTNELKIQLNGIKTKYIRETEDPNHPQELFADWLLELQFSLLDGKNGLLIKSNSVFDNFANGLNEAFRFQ